ncbi:MAG: peptide chain release factor 2 [Deltaproteobacteria bacterium]|nr:peptide chain release factor 2 [Deltaproteobacteria bacterium]
MDWKSSNTGSKRYGGLFDIAAKRQRIAAIDEEMGKQAFWDNPQRAAGVQKERAELAELVDAFGALESGLKDLVELNELAEAEGDEEFESGIVSEMQDLEAGLRKMELRRMLGGPNDHRDAFLSINAGAGGTESCDWAEMLLRMYLRYCERRGWASSVTDYQPGDEAGVKSVTAHVAGSNAYGFLRAEMGIHRLVRISPFDASKRRHTSFCSVFVYPEIDDTIEVEIRDEDLRIDTYRASGAGGQHVNKTDSAVRLTHLPTGIVVACQNERSQHRNKATAMKLLRARLYEKEMEKRRAEEDALHAQKKEIAWGSQIRSYVLQPYRMVKDHRTGTEAGDVDRVLDGDLDTFIEAYLIQAGSSG